MEFILGFKEDLTGVLKCSQRGRITNSPPKRRAHLCMGRMCCSGGTGIPHQMIDVVPITSVQLAGESSPSNFQGRTQLEFGISYRQLSLMHRRCNTYIVYLGESPDTFLYVR